MTPTTFALELQACLGEVLGEPVAEAPAGIDPLRFYKHVLGGRNLGLVPIDDAASFDWPGKWIAAIGGHAVVLFGSPSGIWLDPAGAYRDGARAERGWMVTPLDLQLATRDPYGRAAGTGTVAGILVAPAAEAPLARVDDAEAIAGSGLAGDRYAAGAGTFSAPGLGYELTLVEAEVLEEIDLSWEDARRNLVTRGISLNALVGRRFRVGPVECIGRRLAEPCAHLERLSRPGLLRPLVHRGGLRADIVSGGPIRVGDDVQPLD